MRLKGKVSIITGSGGGMGRVAALRFAAEGSRVVVADVQAEAADETARQIVAAGGEAAPVAVDISDRGRGAGHGRDWPCAEYGRVDVLYNNAGIMPEADHSVVDTPVEVWDQVMAVNVRGVYLACKHAIPAMLEHRSGSIINVSSFVALLGCSVPQDAYTASKGAVVALTRSLAVQFAPQGIRTNAILPGPGRDAAADGLAGQGREGQADPPGAQPHAGVSASRRRSRPWRSISPRTNRPGPTAPLWSSTAASASTTFRAAERATERAMDRTCGDEDDPGPRRGARRARWGQAGRPRAGDVRHATWPSGSTSAAAASRARSSTSRTGKLVGDRLRVPTPQPSVPREVVARHGRAGPAAGGAVACVPRATRSRLAWASRRRSGAAPR